MFTLDLSGLTDFLPETWLDDRIPALERAHAMLERGDGPGGEFTGWVRLPRDYDRAEFARIKRAAARIREQSDVLLVIGIGGSYLGARAVLELLRSPLYNLHPDRPRIFFTGNTLSADAVAELMSLLRDKDFSINIISKSGTTTEPAVAFRIFRALLEQRYGKEGARTRICATTDASRGALKAMADAEGYETFTIPDDVGGRYSVLTAVGLLPLAAAGIDIDRLMEGARQAMDALLVPGRDNPAWRYAAARHALYGGGKRIELLACHEPSFRFFAEWWKQLYGESEGKGGGGLFPASVEYTADLHSMGQYVQDGQRLLLETVVCFLSPACSMTVPFDPEDRDGLNFLAGRDLSYLSRQAMRGTALAHADGGVPNFILMVPGREERSAGGLVWFFEFACGLSGYLLGVNPFDQPGVEAYKKNMFALLGKPGYEDLRTLLKNRLERS
ncbi:MAG: glucose-6-phosphate isomerase [Bacilli bacterium]|nr:glucose-6-phosphate isomerase [Bacilli bacterium]